MSGLIFNSLVCLVIAGGPAEGLVQSREAQSRDRVSAPGGSPRQLDSAPQAAHVLVGPIKLVESSKDPLLVELGRSRLLRFPAGIRRTAVSNADVSDVVQVGPKDVLVLGRSQGATSFTVWPASSEAVPSVIVVRVERKHGLDK